MTKTDQLRQYFAKHPKGTEGAAAKRVGCSRALAHNVKRFGRSTHPGKGTFNGHDHVPESEITRLVNSLRGRRDQLNTMLAMFEDPEIRKLVG